MSQDNFVIIMTDRCNARCEICGFSCGPERKNVISEQLLLDTIDQASAMEGMKTVCFSGGEPTLFPDLLIKGAERARKKKLRVILATNGHWGKWPTERMTKFFQALKPDAIHFSTDAFHRPFINDKTLGRAVAFTYAMGVEATIRVIYMKAGSSAQELWKSMGPYKQLYPFSSYGALRYGRAMQFRRGDFFETRYAEKCHCSPISRFGVAWNGVVLPCCNYEAFYSCLALGNAQDTPLEDLLRTPVMGLIQILQNEGFSSLLDAATQVAPTLLVDNFSFACRVCNALFRSPAFIREYVPLIQPDATRKVAQEYLDFMEDIVHFSGDQWIETDANQRVSITCGGKLPKN